MTLPLSCIRLRGLNDVEFTVETILPAGLPGRSMVEGVIDSGTTGCGIATEETEGEDKGITNAAGV